VLSHRLLQIQGHPRRCQQLPIKVVRLSARVRRCLKCWRNIHHERYAAHDKRCTKKLKCHLCQVWFKEAAIQKHRDECRQRFRECGRCKKAKIPAGELEAHLSTCQFKRWHTCDKGIRVVDLDDHRKTCPYYQCSRYSRKKIAAEDAEFHRRTCQIVYCKDVTIELGKAFCPLMSTSPQNARLASDVSHQISSASINPDASICTICHARLPNASVLQDHQGPCADRAREA
jgi:hypothetical protein